MKMGCHRHIVRFDFLIRHLMGPSAIDLDQSVHSLPPYAPAQPQTAQTGLLSPGW